VTWRDLDDAAPSPAVMPRTYLGSAHRTPTGDRASSWSRTRRRVSLRRPSARREEAVRVRRPSRRARRCRRARSQGASREVGQVVQGQGLQGQAGL